MAICGSGLDICTLIDAPILHLAQGLCRAYTWYLFSGSWSVWCTRCLCEWNQVIFCITCEVYADYLTDIYNDPLLPWLHHRPSSVVVVWWGSPNCITRFFVERHWEISSLSALREMSLSVGTNCVYLHMPGNFHVSLATSNCIKWVLPFWTFPGVMMKMYHFIPEFPVFWYVNPSFPCDYPFLFLPILFFPFCTFPNCMSL